MSEEVSTLDHLIRVGGICQIPQESRTAHDGKVLREARNHIQREQEKQVESRGTTRGDGPVGSSGSSQEGKKNR